MDLVKKFTQQTLVLLKPDTLERGLAGEIISRLERVGLKIVDIKMVVPTEEFALKHYPVTDEWYQSVGERSIADFEKNSMVTKDILGTDNAIEIGKLIHKWNVERFTGSHIIALVVEGINSVEVVRKLCGPTLPLLAPAGTIRGDYSSTSAVVENSLKLPIRNLIHASGSVEEAEREIDLWFGKN